MLLSFATCVAHRNEKKLPPTLEIMCVCPPWPLGVLPRVKVMAVKSCSAGGGGEEASGTSSPSSSSKSPRAPGKVSAGLTARMKAINLDSSAGVGEMAATAAAVAASKEQEPPPPPAPAASSGSGSSPRVSPGLAARLQVSGGLRGVLGGCYVVDSVDRAGWEAGDGGRVYSI